MIVELDKGNKCTANVWFLIQANKVLDKGFINHETDEYHNDINNVRNFDFQE